MTPEAIKVLETCETHVTDHLFPSRQTLATKAKAAIDEGKFDLVTELTDRLKSHSEKEVAEAREDFAAACGKVREVLIQSGLAYIDIPDIVAPPPSPAAGKKPVGPFRKESYPIEIKKKRELKARTRLPGLIQPKKEEVTGKGPFLPFATPIGIQAVIAREPETDLYVHKTSPDAAQAMLKPEYRQDPEAVTKATFRLSREKVSLARRIGIVADKTGVQTIRELFQPLLPQTKVDAWKDFYELAIDSYGDMSPKDFVTQVLNRFR